MSKKGAAKVPQEQSSYEFRDVVLAKVRGYPPWPGMVVDPAVVPAKVAKERPSGKKATWYVVRFFPTGDYAWVVPKDISKLKEHEIESYINEPHKRSGDLLAGYKIALDPKQWEEDKKSELEDAERDAEDAQVDELDDETSGDGDKKSAKSKKRKRDSDAGGSATTKKAPAAAKKAKKGSTEPTTKKKAVNGKGKKNGVKSKTMVESEDDGGDDDDEAGPSKHASPPPAKKSKVQEEDGDAALADDPEAQKVREWRHKLQKAFLNKQLPKDEDMPACDELFTTVESYENMTIGYLQFSKIGKVMRHIQQSSVDKVPRDADFHFRERAKALVEKWHQILHSNNANGDATASKPADDCVDKGDEDAKGEDDTGDNTMDVDAKGEIDPTPADDKENVPEEDAVGEDVNMSAIDGDITALGDVSMAESAVEA